MWTSVLLAIIAQACASSDLMWNYMRMRRLCMILVLVMQLLPGGQASSSLRTPSILHTNQTLLSPSGIFELGFYSLSGTTNFTLAIWYAAPIKTVVWMLERTVKLSSSAQLEISSAGALVLSDPANGILSTIASANSSSGAYLLDTGNLVLLDAANATVWQSFDTPTDTLLPGQNYTSLAVTSIRSWISADDWGQGSYFSVWDNTPRLVLAWISQFYTNGLEYYFDTAPSDHAYVDSTGSLLVVDSTTGLTHTFLNSTGVDDGSLRRVTLDLDGGLRSYRWVSGSASWSVEANVIQDQCTVYGECGPYATCISPTKGGPAVCSCPKDFVFIDPTDHTQGCERSVQLSPALCNNSEALQFVNLTSVDYPIIGDYFSANIAFTACEQKCLANCSCDGVIYSFEAGTCWLKQGPLYNGNSAYSTYTNGDRNAYLKVSPFPLAPSSAPSPAPSPAVSGGGPSDFAPHPSSGYYQQKHRVKLSTLLPSVLGGGIGMALLLIFFFILRKRNLQLKAGVGPDLRKLLSSPVFEFKYSELEAATNNFRDEIGKGGYGAVYKGKVGKGREIVAIKRLTKLDPSGEKGFVAEVTTIGSIHHINLVRLRGFCAEGSRRLLVFEYVENGSLDKFLFKPETPTLDWKVRFQIVVETAKAVMYLHEDCVHKIIHRDLKPENILLDKLFHVKLADFGIARLMNREHTRVSTDNEAVGTYGYLAPELIYEHCMVTPKVDIYSFGMVILEIVGGRRNIMSNPVNLDRAVYFPAFVVQKMESGDYDQIVDPLLGADFSIEQVGLLVKVALWCIQDRPEMRPTMRLVLQMLEGLVPVSLPIPTPNHIQGMLNAIYKDNARSEEQHTSTDSSSDARGYFQ